MDVRDGGYNMTTWELISESSTVTLTYPLPNKYKSGLQKNLALFDFVSGTRKVIDRGFSDDTLYLEGYERLSLNTKAQIEQKVEDIWEIENENETVEVSGLGNDTDGVYVIENFHIETVKGTDQAYFWALTLKKTAKLTESLPGMPGS